MEGNDVICEKVLVGDAEFNIAFIFEGEAYAVLRTAGEKIVVVRVFLEKDELYHLKPPFEERRISGLTEVEIVGEVSVF
ncbi:hypothetical protein KKC45_04050 [Patescibacteria group bacterium]|nr:hypothetical protein [Patescibacteria group bacterium]